jgi:hypothetical protein
MIHISKLIKEAWSATPIMPPVGKVRSGYQRIIDRTLKSGKGDITLLRNKKKEKLND